MSDTPPPREPALAGRGLLRRIDRAALATRFGEEPYVSLVLVAADMDGSPLLFLSDLAQHTQNLAADSRVSMLFDGTAGYRDPLTGPRLTVLGRAERTEDPRAMARYVARHPSAELYAGFRDFHLFRVVPERGHLVAGFGKIDWIDGSDLRGRIEAEPLAAAEAGIVAHMNDDHSDAVHLYAERLLGSTGEGWRLTGVDPEGIDLRRNGDVARLDFPAPVSTPSGARAALIELVNRARRQSAS